MKYYIKKDFTIEGIEGCFEKYNTIELQNATQEEIKLFKSLEEGGYIEKIGNGLKMTVGEFLS